MLEKKAGIPRIFGSISAVCERTGINPDKLYYHFSRAKRSEFEDEEYRIVKCEVIRSRKTKFLVK